jgi:DNA modification methylase
MEHRAYLHRHWDVYASARRQDDSHQHGLVYAIALVRHQLNISAMKGKPFHSVAISQRDTSRTEEAQSPKTPPMRQVLNKSVTLWQADFHDALPLIPDGLVDLAIIDPPYFIRQADWSVADYYLAKNGMKPRFNAGWDRFDSLDQYVEFTEAWITGVLRTLKDTASMFITGTFHNIGIINYLLQKLDVPIIGDIVWLKRSARPSISTRRLRSTHETILWVAKSGKYAGDPLKKAGIQMGSVWQIESVNQFRHEVTGHPSQKPLALHRRMLDMCEVEGGTVLDPMAGSGTTAVAAMRWGMKAILIEREAAYCKLIRKRIGAEGGDKAVATNDDTAIRMDVAAD